MTWGFWCWQCIWIGVLFWKLTGADSYEGLFDLQSVLDQWNGSFLVRLLLMAVQGGSNWASVISFTDILGLALSVLAVSAGVSRRGKLWAAGFLFMLVFGGIGAASCFQAGSLLQAAYRLQMIGWFGGAFILPLFAVSMYGLARNARRLG